MDLVLLLLVLLCLSQVYGYDQRFLAAIEAEALALIRPSYMPGTDVYEEAVLWFAARARTQMATVESALITYDMAVSIINFPSEIR